MSDKKTKQEATEKKQVKMVDFRAIDVMNIEDKPERLDLSKQLGNLIYSQSKDIGEAELARDMYKNGRIEIDKEKAEIVLKFSENFSYPVREAVIKAVEI